MIGYIKGTVAEVGVQTLTLDRDGIGFQIYVPGGLLDGGLRVGDAVKIYTYLHVKEDLLQLYGFASGDEREVFKLLLNVNGVGPKAALGLLSGMSADELRFAVLSDDAAALAKAPGIGKKTAQKLILELKDKFSLEDAVEQRLSNAAAAGAAAQAGDTASDAVQALVALGYSGTEALQAVRKVEMTEEMDTEAILKAALKFIF